MPREHSFTRSMLMAAFGMCLTSIPAMADVVHADDVIIDGSLCASDDNECASGEVFPANADIKIKDALPVIYFEDTSTSSSPDRHYRITIGGAGTTASEYFAIEDAGASGTQATQVFRVDGGARANALHIDSSGEVGIGTATPAFDLHIVTGNTPGLRLEQDGSSSFTPQIWDIYGNEGIFEIKDTTHSNRRPFRIQPNANDTSLYIATTGRIGFGTSSPDASLDIDRSDGTAKLLVQERNSAPTYRNLLQLNGGGLQTVMSLNNSDPLGWEFAVKGTPVSRFEINKLGSGKPFKFLADGTLLIQGAIFTGGGSCGGGCDYVFQPGYELETIDEHAAFMWDKGHLEGLGPTPENARSINLTEKVGGVINELEKAHIYIERLHDEAKERALEIDRLSQTAKELSATVKEKDAEITHVTGRLEAVEASLGELRAMIANGS